MDRIAKSLCTELRVDDGAIYIKITVATGVGDTTTPVAMRITVATGR
jgi:hypothetical protein